MNKAHLISPKSKIEIYDLPYMILARYFDACFLVGTRGDQKVQRK